ncbi:MAG: tetratricopeptide repeat protein [Pyrinomonadaceae bacterium]
MNLKAALLLFMGVTFGFAGGFFVANGLNKSRITELETQSVLQSNNQPETNSQSQDQLSAEEIKAKIAEADSNPKNFDYQKNLGAALFQYAQSKQDKTLLAEAERLLSRANSLKPDDYNLLVSLAIVNFDIAQINNDPKANQKSRELFAKSLSVKPDNPDVLADYAATFLEFEPEDVNKAQAELQKALKINPKNERALQFMVQVKLKMGETDQAKSYLAQLKQVNANNPSIAGYETQMGSGK